ncbi:hypothetical protein JOB18_016118 [Solea senegalensis]|uniref:Uncharacterized protein n=1 Tax=Solea senegalensis TaxID=28829 RepID=A0AAV6QHU1_SOLSE|nr:hypothetical protein JOB18_016118 [Solea senegalensis]
MFWTCTCGCPATCLGFLRNPRPSINIQDLVPGAKREMEDMMIGVYVIRHEGAADTDPPEDVGTIIEDVEVLQGLRYFCEWVCTPVWPDLQLKSKLYKRPTIHF